MLWTCDHVQPRTAAGGAHEINQAIVNRIDHARSGSGNGLISVKVVVEINVARLVPVVDIKSPVKGCEVSNGSIRKSHSVKINGMTSYINGLKRREVFILNSDRMAARNVVGAVANSRGEIHGVA